MAGPSGPAYLSQSSGFLYEVTNPHHMFHLPDPEKFRMKDKLEEAIKRAKEKNPAAKLVRIFGMNLNPDGTVMLGQQGKFTPRWEYAFKDDKNGEAPPQFITVLFMAPKVPMVNANAGNVSDMPSFSDEQLGMLANSDLAAKAFLAIPDYKPFIGNDNESIVYLIQDNKPVIHLTNWKGQMVRLDAITLEKL